MTPNATELTWFAQANSNPPFGFYPFKDRFLRRFARHDGYDLQHVPKICWRCDGSGQYEKGVECRSCDGSGIYTIAEHWLERWDLAGRIYHRPVTHAEVWHLHGYRYPDPKNEIEGRIKHESVSSKIANRAFYRLMLRFEPVTFFEYVKGSIGRGLSAWRAKWYFRLIRLRDKLDLFPAVEDQDVPF